MLNLSLPRISLVWILGNLNSRLCPSELYGMGKSEPLLGFPVLICQLKEVGRLISKAISRLEVIAACYFSFKFLGNNSTCMVLMRPWLVNFCLLVFFNWTISVFILFLPIDLPLMGGMLSFMQNNNSKWNPKKISHPYSH